jgi:SM-20-related protein
MRSALRTRPAPTAPCRRIEATCRASASAAHPLRDAASGALSLSLASLRSAGIYSVYDSNGELQYVGVSRQIAGSLDALARAFDASTAASATATPLPGATAADLQAAWRAAITAHGAIPPGNAATADPRWAAPKGKGLVFRPDTDVRRWASARVAAMLTQQRCAELSERGYIIIDSAIDEEACVAARRAAEALDASGALRSIPAQMAAGRRDRSAALALPAPGASALVAGYGSAPLPPHDGSDAAALADAAALLMAVPAALMAASARDGLAPAQSLQLAVYDGDGNAFYSRHVDNPGTGVPGAADGPPGLRISDRAVTAILYLNPQWRDDDGGELRLWPPVGDNWMDVQPRAGRLLLFDSVRVEHEVRPCRARRWALSAWLPRADACVTSA